MCSQFSPSTLRISSSEKPFLRIAVTGGTGFDTLMVLDGTTHNPTVKTVEVTL